MRPRRLGGDAGAATTELVIVTPAFLFLILLTIQSGLYFHAVSVASAAAQDGARTAAVGGTAAARAAGEQEAEQLMQDLASDLVVGANATASSVDGGQMVRMTVTGDVVEVFVVPGVPISLAINESAESAVERFRPAGDVPNDTSP